MKNVLVIVLLVVSLVSCTTERYISPQDMVRASDLNAQLGLGYLKQGQYKRALKKLDKAIEFNPDNASAYHYKAEVYRRLSELDKAETLFKKAMELDPKNQLIESNYGVFLCDKGEFNRAIQIFQTPLNDPLYENKANIYENIGICRMRQGNITEAEKSFKQALALNSRLPKSLIQLSQIRYDEGLKQESYRLFSKYVSIAPHTPESLWLGILLESERGAKNTVASYKVKLKGKFPDAKETKLLLRLERQGKI